MKYEQIVRAVSETPWAIMPSKLDVIIDIVSMRAEGERLTAEEIQARIGGKPATREASTQGVVAIIPIYGVLMPRADLMSELSGATSVVRLMESIRAAANDPQIDTIVLDIDSPGGSVFQIAELAAEIRAAREQKKVVAVANALAASAAYWLGSQADEFAASPSALVGSIGIVGMHVDQSELDAALGLNFTYVSAGEFKTEGNPHEPLSGEARAAKQTIVDDMYAGFIADVALGRGVSTEKVLADFGQGRVVTARVALKRGMVDRIDTLEGVIAGLLEGDAAEPGSSFAHAGDFDYTPPPRSSIASVTTAATSGLSFTPFNEEAAAARRVAGELLNRADSLRRVTAAKRDQLVAVRDAHAAVVAGFDDWIAEAGLAESEPHADALLAEAVRFEQLRSITT